MAESSAAAQWLQKALLAMCDDGTAELQLDAEVVATLVSYCELAPPPDAAEYLSSIFGQERAKDIISEYLQRREGTCLSTSQIDSSDEPLQAYVKSKTEEVWSASNKKATKGLKKKNGLLGGDESTSRGENINGQPTETIASPLNANSSKSRGKKGVKGVSLAETAGGAILFPRGGPCNCQARRHKLINNCLSCGKIVCEQEGEGPCNFCGTLVLKEGSTYAGLENGGMLAMSDTEAAAQAFKDRLVEYNKNSSLRTTIIDDQSDYFETEGNSWISAKEKKVLEKKLQEAEQTEMERRKQVIVTIDLLGRKVVMADDGGIKESGKGESILVGPISHRDEGSDKADHMKPNPYITETPRFIAEPSVPRSHSKQREVKIQTMGRSGRIQHSDPVSEALTFRNSRGSASLCVDNSWQEPKLKGEYTFAVDDEDKTECELDRIDGRENYVKKSPSSASGTNGSPLNRASYKIGNSSRERNTPVFFDICEPSLHIQDGSIQSPVHLNSPMLQKQAHQVPFLEGVAAKILHPGLVILKNWLSMDDQIYITNECRQFGKGVGGFYKPTYGEGNSMHLWMMCFGKHWEPTTGSYLDTRANYDNSSPPPLPVAFVSLAERALWAAQSVCGSDSSMKKMKGKFEPENLPSMHPDICIANFYERSGRLGMHQDRDESRESIARGAPVISFSIGDTAHFRYGKDRNIESSEHLFLESGDVLIFGGSARMIFHAVDSILPGTAPSLLISETNLRPGRLNLTFRELRS